MAYLTPMPLPLKSWLQRVRDGLSYWRDLETIGRIITAIGAVNAWIVTGTAVVAFVVSYLQGVPLWVSVGLAWATVVIVGSVAVHAALRLQASPSPPAEPQHERNPRRYRLHDGVLWYLAAWYRNDGVRVDGPLCPEDKATLSYVPRNYPGREPRAVWAEDRVGQRAGVLVCPIDRRHQYFLGDTSQQIETARGEVERAFEGDLRDGRIPWP